MKALGLIRTTLGFTAGAFYSVSGRGSIDWTFYGIALAAGVAGVVMLRVATHSASRGHGKIEGDLKNVESGLAEIVAKISPLADNFDPQKVYDLPDIIDAEFELPISRFVEAREAIAHRYGVDAYAEIMSEFATGERYLNRVWSCAAEGYVDEADEYLTNSRDRFVAAEGVLQKFHSRGTAANSESPSVADAVPSAAHT